jgi:hypothetical protein
MRQSWKVSQHLSGFFMAKRIVSGPALRRTQHAVQMLESVVRFLLGLELYLDLHALYEVASRLLPVLPVLRGRRAEGRY